MLDAVLTGAKGVNLWSSFRVPPPQRSARLYRALVERGLASSVSGALLPTEQPFLYTVSVDGDRRHAAGVGRGGAARGAGSRARATASRRPSSREAKAQLHARLVFDNDSVTNIAHQLGYFETIGGVDVFTALPPRIAAVTLDEVADGGARRCSRPSNRTVGWFDPLPVGDVSAACATAGRRSIDRS